MGLPHELYNRCRSTLLKCNEFNSNDTLRAVFVTRELYPFCSGLPEATNKGERVDKCLAYLRDKLASGEQPVLRLLLLTLCDHYQAGNALRDELEILCVEVERELNTQTKQTERIETRYLTRLGNDQDKQGVANYILGRAKAITLPPFDATSTAIISKIEAIINDKADALNEVEAFILLVAICLPHLLRLYDKAVEEAIDTEQEHQFFNRSDQHKYTEGLISIEQVYWLAERLNQETSAPSNTGRFLKDLASELSTVANARIEFNLDDSKYSPDRLYGKPINLRLLGALLHLANFINLDESVNPEPPPYLSQAGWPERYYWWRQAYVRDVSIESQWLQLHIRLPKGYEDEYKPILVDPLDEEFSILIRAYALILFQAGVNLNLLPPQITYRRGYTDNPC